MCVSAAHVDDSERDCGSTGNDAHSFTRYELLVLGDREEDMRAFNASHFAVVSTFRGLRLGAQITARIRAVNGAGASPWSTDALPVRTLLHCYVSHPEQPCAIKVAAADRALAAKLGDNPFTPLRAPQRNHQPACGPLE